MVRPKMKYDMGWNKDKVYDRVQASMRGVYEDTSCLRENRSERAVS